MRTIQYSQVLNAAALLWQGTSELSAPDAGLLMGRINARAGEFWERFFWPEWTTIEQRWFRPAWDATAVYNLGDQVYLGSQNAYYQALQTTPVGLSPDDPAALNYFWTPSLPDYSGLNQYDATVSYAPGDQVMYTDGQAYQCIHLPFGGNPLGAPGSGDWALLTEFETVVAYEQPGRTPLGEVRRAWNSNPRTHRAAAERPMMLTDVGINVTTRDTHTFLEFRLRPPQWIGAVWSARAVYQIDDQVYFAGDFWRAVAVTAAGESPASAAAKWSKVAFPYVFRNAIAQAVFADTLRIDGQQDKYVAELAEANRLAKGEFDKIERQQGQARQMNVRTRNTSI